MNNLLTKWRTSIFGCVRKIAKIIQGRPVTDASNSAPTHPPTQPTAPAPTAPIGGNITSVASGVKRVDFPAAAKRHFRDATLLEVNGHIANAAQLYGFTAECGLKSLVVGLGCAVDTDGSPLRNSTPNFRKHIDLLAHEIIHINTWASGRAGAKYTAMIPTISSFSSWSVDHRYWRETAIPSNLPDWKRAAQEIMNMLQTAQNDGVIN